MNKHLEKQLKKHLKDNSEPTPEMKAFIESINESFDHFDKTNYYLQELEKKNKELDEFAHIVSHDLKAPLRAFVNLSQWIEEEIAENLTPQVKEYFALMKGRAFRMEKMINAILAYSKADKTKEIIEMIDCGCLLREVIDSLECPDTFRINITGNFPKFRTEVIKLQQVFANLISNSIKYNDKESGEVEIGCFDMEDSCQFYVQDNGPGIEPQYHKKVFMNFQTLVSRDTVDSTGIGLAIVKKILVEKGGKIWIESQKGKGAKFCFIWPKNKDINYQTHDYEK